MIMMGKQPKASKQRDLAQDQKIFVRWSTEAEGANADVFSLKPRYISRLGLMER